MLPRGGGSLERCRGRRGRGVRSPSSRRAAAGRSEQARPLAPSRPEAPASAGVGSPSRRAARGQRPVPTPRAAAAIHLSLPISLPPLPPRSFLPCGLPCGTVATADEGGEAEVGGGQLGHGENGSARASPRGPADPGPYCKPAGTVEVGESERKGWRVEGGGAVAWRRAKQAAWRRHGGSIF